MIPKNSQSSDGHKNAGGVEIDLVEWHAQLASSAAKKQTRPRSDKYWSGSELAPDLAIILWQLMLGIDDLNKRKAKLTNLEQLPYSLGGMSFTFAEMLRHQADLAKAFPPEQGGIRVLPPDATEPLAFLLDSFFDHSRRMTNAICLYLSARYQISIPQSMADLIKQLEKDEYLLGDVRCLLKHFWKDYGLRVKHYRELAQHHSLLISECRLFFGRNGQVCLYLAIPNNLEVKSVDKLAYENPTVHAILFMRKTFYASVRLVNRILFVLLDPLKEDNRALLPVKLKTSLRISALQPGVSTVPYDIVDKELQTIMLQLRSERRSSSQS